jgi:hypothetical protein
MPSADTRPDTPQHFRQTPAAGQSGDKAALRYAHFLEDFVYHSLTGLFSTGHMRTPRRQLTRLTLARWTRPNHENAEMCDGQDSFSKYQALAGCTVTSAPAPYMPRTAPTVSGCSPFRRHAPGRLIATASSQPRGTKIRTPPRMTVLSLPLLNSRPLYQAQSPDRGARV